MTAANAIDKNIQVEDKEYRNLLERSLREVQLKMEQYESDAELYIAGLNERH
jgi:hypothetical protein